MEAVDFADDLCLMFNKPSYMGEKLAELRKEAKKVRLKVNKDKTKDMWIISKNQKHFIISVTIKQVSVSLAVWFKNRWGYSVKNKKIQRAHLFN